MKSIHSHWKDLGLSRKFNLIFALLLAFVLLVALTSYLSFLSIGKAEEDIRQSTKLGHIVLQMDQGHEKARRLANSFFLHYQHIGLQKAHERYAQPSVREIANVVSLSSELKELLFQSGQSSISGISRADINLYLASAKRFGDTSIEAVELVTRRGAPQNGVQDQLRIAFLAIGEELQAVSDLSSQHKQMLLQYKEYLITRQRPFMQSALNSLSELRLAVGQKPSLESAKEHHTTLLLDHCQNLAEELLAIDLALSGKLNDFSLQERTIAPISTRLIELSRQDVGLAEQHIEQAHKITAITMVVITLLAIFFVLNIARFMHNSVTRTVLSLTDVANEFRNGNLNVRVQEEGRDELGQLGSIFNAMAARLQDLVENLEKKVAQRTAELAASEKRFRHLVQDLPRIAVQGYDRNRNVVYWNRASEKLYGYREDEALGQKLEDLIVPEAMKEEVIQAINDCYVRGLAIPSSELTLQDKDGSDVYVYSSRVMIGADETEKIIYSVDIDLAELKLAQEERRRSESFYRQLFDHATSGVAVYEAIDDGKDFIIKDFNHTGELIEQISRDKLIGRPVSEVFPGVEEIGLLDVFRRVWRTGEPVNHPVSFYKDKRIEGWRENRIYKLPTGEVVAVYDDLTAQKQVEEENRIMELRLQRAQKMEAIGLLAGGVAHDLNNILSAIVGYPELLLLQLPRESEFRNPIGEIQKAGERAAAVVADLLTVARGVASTRETIDLNSLVLEFLDSPEFRQIQAEHPHVRYIRELTDTQPAISCSPVHVTKSLLNLVLNGSEAIAHTGTITLSTSSLSLEPQWAEEQGLKPGNYVVLRIVDSGSGIPDKDLEHIFEPFYTKKAMGRKSGTGLGLSVVWNTVQDHNGTVSVTSSEQGTSFDLYFPAAENGTAVKKEQVPASEIQGNGENILVVDDEPQQQDLARDMLQHFGYTVKCVASGEEALAYLHDHRVDLVLLDMLMDPGINGRRTYEQMLGIRPGQKAVIASGFSESDDVKATLQMGAGTFIEKPYSMAELGRAVKEVLDS